MKNKFFVVTLISCFFIASVLNANGVRLYEDRDHATLCSLLKSHPEDLLVQNEPGVNRSQNERFAQTEKYLTSKKYITQVYSKNDETVGFITYTKEIFKAPFFDAQSKQVTQVFMGNVALLAVQDAHRRQGIGKELLEVAMADMKNKNVEMVMLTTKVTNTASRSLYEKFGFKLLFGVVPGVPDCIYVYKYGQSGHCELDLTN